MALLVLACMGYGKEVTADEWAIKGSLVQQLQYNDNMAFSTTGKKSVVGYLLTPNLQATRKTEVLDIGFQGIGIYTNKIDVIPAGMTTCVDTYAFNATMLAGQPQGIAPTRHGYLYIKVFKT